MNNSNIKSKFLSSAFILLVASAIVKVISAVYKIPLTAFIGATGRGYFAVAYNIYMPIHAITMGAFPIALSRLVSTYNSKNDLKMICALKKSAHKLFFIVGFAGMAVMLIFAKPYSQLIANAPKSIFTILVLAPSILFSCMAASYRGFYEGYLNMVPTAVSQIIEVVFKAVFGLLFAKISMAYLLNSFAQTGFVLGTYAQNEGQALSLIYPYTSAFSMLGATIGDFVSFAFLSIYSKYKFANSLSPSFDDISCATRELLSFSLAIMLSTAVQSIFQFLDTASVQFSLGNIPINNLKSAFSNCLQLATVADADLTTYVYGLFSTSLDFKNIVPGFTMTLGVCAVPAISNACQNRNAQKLNLLSNSILKYTVMLSTFLGFFIALESKNILTLFYSSNKDIVVGTYMFVSLFCLTSFVYSVAGVLVFCVQAVGLPQKSIVSFALAGVVRVVLNFLLISNSSLILYATVISGFVGYLIIIICNLSVLKKCCSINFSFAKCFFKPFSAIFLSTFIYVILCSKIMLSQNIFVSLLLKATIFTLIYVLVSIIFGNLSLFDLKFVIKSKKYGLNT